jgi:hypothetical protein
MKLLHGVASGLEGGWGCVRYSSSTGFLFKFLLFKYITWFIKDPPA